MKPPSKESIKANQGQYYLVRHSSYNGRTTERVTWQVCQKLSAFDSYPELWRLEREYTRKADAMVWLRVITG